jgi:hypothetical protein
MEAASIELSATRQFVPGLAVNIVAGSSRLIG